MKKLIVTMFLLSLSLLLPLQVFAQENELEAAISRLWLAGPDAKIEQTLKTHSESSDQAVSARARFHLTCLQAINDREKAAQLLTQLKKDAQSAEEKETVEKLSRIVQERSANKEDGMQKKVSLDFNDVELGLIVKLIAKQSGENRNALVRQAVSEWLNRHGKPQWPEEVLAFQGMADMPPFEAGRDGIKPPVADPLA